MPPCRRHLLSHAALALALALGPAPASAPAAPPVPPDTRQLEGWWADLAGADAARAYRAVCSLADRPREAIPFLRPRLRPATTPDPRRLARLLADLDSDRFAARDQATRELAALGA